MRHILLSTGIILSLGLNAQQGTLPIRKQDAFETLCGKWDLDVVMKDGNIPVTQVQYDRFEFIDDSTFIYELSDRKEGGKWRIDADASMLFLTERVQLDRAIILPIKQDLELPVKRLGLDQFVYATINPANSATYYHIYKSHVPVGDDNEPVNR